MTESRILIVDADATHAGHCDAFLSGSGFEVTVASDVDGARNALARARYEAVLVDAMLDPNMRGLQTSLAESDALVFGMSDILLGPTNRDIAIALHGCADYLAKPVSADTVLTWLRRALEDRFPSAPAPQSSAPVAAEPEPVPVAAPAPIDAPAPVAETLDEPPAPRLTDFPSTSTAPEPVEVPKPAAAPSLSASADLPAMDSASGAVPPVLDAQRVGDRGGLAATPLATIVSSIWRGRRSGALRVSHGAVTRTIGFADGAIVSVESDAAEDSLAGVLIADGRLQPAQRDAIARNLGEAALENAATYVDAGVLPETDAAALADLVARRVLVDTFGWVTGTWRFDPGSATGSPLVASPQIIWEAAQHTVPTAALDTALAEVASRAPRWVGTPPGRDDIVLTRTQRGLLGAIDGATTVEALIGDATAPPSAAALLYTLTVCGFVSYAR